MKNIASIHPILDQPLAAFQIVYFGRRYQLDGHTYALDRKQPDGPNCLHVCVNRTSKVRWQIENIRTDGVSRTIIDPAGNAGFPGEMRIRADFSLRSPSLCVQFDGSTKATTLTNITHHA